MKALPEATTLAMLKTPILFTQLVFIFSSVSLHFRTVLSQFIRSSGWVLVSHCFRSLSYFQQKLSIFGVDLVQYNQVPTLIPQLYITRTFSAVLC